MDLFILFHKPTGRFADEYGTRGGVTHTCGLAYKCEAKAIMERDGLDSIGLDPSEWIVMAKPENVITDWIV